MKRVRSIVIAQTMEVEGGTLIVPIHKNAYLVDNGKDFPDGKQHFAIMLKEEYESGDIEGGTEGDSKESTSPSQTSSEAG